MCVTLKNIVCILTSKRSDPSKKLKTNLFDFFFKLFAGGSRLSLVPMSFLKCKVPLIDGPQTNRNF